MNWKFTAAGVGATALAGWLARPPLPAEKLAAPVSRGNAARAAAAVPDIGEQALRLQLRMRQEAAYREPSRNPFRFGAAPAEPSPVARPARTPAIVEEPPPAAAIPAPPIIKLSGVATDIVDGVSRRTAILSTPQGILLVREGDAVGAEYRVQAVDAEAVELVTSDGTVRRLNLATPP